MRKSSWLWFLQTNLNSYLSKKKKKQVENIKPLSECSIHLQPTRNVNLGACASTKSIKGRIKTSPVHVRWISVNTIPYFNTRRPSLFPSLCCDIFRSRPCNVPRSNRLADQHIPVRCIPFVGQMDTYSKCPSKYHRRLLPFNQSKTERPSRCAKSSRTKLLYKQNVIQTN